MSKTREPLRTQDLALATYLNLEGHQHERLEMIDRRAAVWVFPGDGCRLRAEDYHDGRAEVEPKAFATKLREVRDELYAFLRQNRSK